MKTTVYKVVISREKKGRAMYDWIDAAVECFHREFGTHPSNWDERQLLHEIREYYTEEQCYQYVMESPFRDAVLGENPFREGV